MRRAICIIILLLSGCDSKLVEIPPAEACDLPEVRRWIPECLASYPDEVKEVSNITVLLRECTELALVLHCTVPCRSRSNFDRGLALECIDKVTK